MKRYKAVLTAKGKKEGIQNPIRYIKFAMIQYANKNLDIQKEYIPSSGENGLAIFVHPQDDKKTSRVILSEEGAHADILAGTYPGRKASISKTKSKIEKILGGNILLVPTKEILKTKKKK